MTRESERNRLVELLDNFNQEKFCINLKIGILEKYADYLLDNGIVVPPVKVGGVVYLVTLNGDIRELTITDIHLQISISKLSMTISSIFYEDGMPYYFQVLPHNINKTVFLTKEEAEKMLKGSKNNG